MSTLEKRRIVPMKDEINMSRICCQRMRKGEKRVFRDDTLGRQLMEGIGIREIVADHILNSKEEFCQPGEIIPVIPGREWRRNSGANNNSQSQVQQLQQSQPVLTSGANNNSQQLQQ